MLAIPLFVSVVLIVCLWAVGDTEVRTKGIFTLVWAVCCAGWFIAEVSILFSVALLILDSVLWWVTFGPSGR